uniref:Uncharacterized protein n=1 Tax=Moniliophthora roreri TaxID=221103 RepID=A0A0W0F6M8_MONRR
MEAAARYSDEAAGLHPALLFVVVSSLLLTSGVAIFKWRFPCTTIEGLEKQVNSIQGLIRASTDVWAEDLLGESEAQFRRTLRLHRDEIDEIKFRLIKQPDSRTRPCQWVLFHWRQLRAIDVCYTGLKDLLASILLKIETGKKARG